LLESYAKFPGKGSGIGLGVQPDADLSMRIAFIATFLSLISGGSLFSGQAALAADPSCLGTASQVRLVIAVENVKSRSGTIMVTVYPDDPQRFLKRGGPVRGLSGLAVPAETPVTHVCVWLPEPGRYGISIYHDANTNRRFDQNFLGLPVEGFGFSNNPATLVGPPGFSAAAFQAAKGDTSIPIRMRYL
jgi:uncharacterized protein (DUF2141 family)